MTGTARALDDLLVLDLAGEQGALCGKMLADMGADVVKIEPVEGDASRGYAPFLNGEPHRGRSLYFWHYNLNKRSVTLNLVNAEGRAIFKRLASAADVLVESFPPGHMEELGLGYDILSADNPRLVMTSITPFGQSGPRRDWKSSDLVALAMGGMMSVCGDPDASPVRAYGNQAYNVASAEAATAVLMAVHSRSITGRGQQIDISLQEAVDSVLEVVNNFYNYQGVIAGRQGTRHGLKGPGTAGEVWPCKDGHVCFLGPEPRQLQALFEWMDEAGMAADLLTDDVYLVGVLSGGRPPEVEEHMYEVIKDFMLTHTMEEIFSDGQKRGVTVAPVTSIDQIPVSPQLKARGFWAEVSHPELGQAFTYPGAPAVYGGSPWAVESRPPLLGEHNQQVYRGLLGVTSSDLESLARTGVI